MACVASSNSGDRTLNRVSSVVVDLDGRSIGVQGAQLQVGAWGGRDRLSCVATAVVPSQLASEQLVDNPWAVA